MTLPTPTGFGVVREQSRPPVGAAPAVFYERENLLTSDSKAVRTAPELERGLRGVPPTVWSDPLSSRPSRRKRRPPDAGPAGPANRDAVALAGVTLRA